MQQAPRLISALRSTVSTDDAVILRIPSAVASVLELGLSREHHPYGVEVVGDPREVFAPGGVRHAFRPLFRWWFTSTLRRQCWNASAAAYVTSHALQSRYPCRAAEYAISDADISSDALARQRELRPEARFRLILVGSLEQYYKAPDVAIAAVAQLVNEGQNLELVIVGDGKYRRALEGLARRLGVGDRVVFRGMLPAGQAVRDELDASDLFVLPSRTEGLPRAMIEAMARRLPCIGSTVGGIPELLSSEDMVPPGDVQALANRIREVITSPNRMQAMSERNFAQAHEYRDEVLGKRRREFYTRIRLATEAWLGSPERRS